jgi:hypothetical protein
MSDIIERLRAWHTPGETITGDVQLYLDAADEIERLRKLVQGVVLGAGGYVDLAPSAAEARVRELEDALWPFVADFSQIGSDMVHLGSDQPWQARVTLGEVRSALNALREGGNG